MGIERSISERQKYLLNCFGSETSKEQETVETNNINFYVVQIGIIWSGIFIQRLLKIICNLFLDAQQQVQNMQNSM